MCGIVGLVGNDEAVDLLFSALKRLEYRGYDSSGMAILDENGLHCRKASGKLEHLKSNIEEDLFKGSTVIGHTRWATHGPATLENAHPHMSPSMALVHNGIVENFHALRQQLTHPWEFKSSTDSEVLLYTLQEAYDELKDPLKALQHVLRKIEGNYSIALLVKNHPHTIFAAKRGSPLVIGKGEKGALALASDSLALSHITNEVIYLEDGDVAVLSPHSIQLFDEHNQAVKRPHKILDMPLGTTHKGDYAHFMLKEIYEQPEALQKTLSHLRDHTHIDTDLDWNGFSRLTVIACGTSYYAGMVAKYWFEHLARLHVDVEIASEFRYRSPVLDEKALAIVISQSGETIDTLSAVQMCKNAGMKTLAILNVEESSIARLVDYTLITQAGPEIGVASTKAFTTQLGSLALLALYAGKSRGSLSRIAYQKNYQDLLACHDLLSMILHDTQAIESVASKLTHVQHALFVGRGTNYPMAMEGALKLKEISYIHAEGYAAGELKHGPIALLDANMPVIVLAPFDSWFAKTASNIQEILCRGACVYVVTDAHGAQELKEEKNDRLHIIEIVNVPEFLTPLCYSIPMQLLAYHVANNRGNDVDQPRNLAKSVTVE
jgi:glucosamine--fructose-6-phosphate aminotransferase (isomerizing)